MIMVVLSKSNSQERINVPDTKNNPDMNFSYICIITLNPEMWPWVKVIVMEYPWVVDCDGVNDYRCIIQIQLKSEDQCARH